MARFRFVGLSEGVVWLNRYLKLYLDFTVFFCFAEFILNAHKNPSNQKGQINLLLNQSAVEQLHYVWTNRVT